MTTETDAETRSTLIELTTGITQSYLQNNQMQPDQVPALIDSVHTKLSQLYNGTEAQEDNTQPQHAPPVKPQNSVRKNEVICLECGKPYKTLKRHLRTEHDLDETGYKERWNLPASMKLVAKSYSEQRSQMAKDLGLGEKARRSASGRKKK